MFDCLNMQVLARCLYLSDYAEHLKDAHASQPYWTVKHLKDEGYLYRCSSVFRKITDTAWAWIAKCVYTTYSTTLSCKHWWRNMPWGRAGWTVHFRNLFSALIKILRWFLEPKEYQTLQTLQAFLLHLSGEGWRRIAVLPCMSPDPADSWWRSGGKSIRAPF